MLVSFAAWSVFAASNLATAHGSFLVDGWRVWTNASVSPAGRVQTAAVPVQIALPSGQTLWVGVASSIHLSGVHILLEKGCALLDFPGKYSLDAPFKSGLAAASNPAGLSKAKEIPHSYGTLREYRPMSQRP